MTPKHPADVVVEAEDSRRIKVGTASAKILQPKTPSTKPPSGTTNTARFESSKKQPSDQDYYVLLLEPGPAKQPYKIQYQDYYDPSYAVYEAVDDTQKMYQSDAPINDQKQSIYYLSKRYAQL